MYTTFHITEPETACCTNQTLKSLGTLQGIFEATIDRIEGKIVVNHTDEVNPEEISKKLKELGYSVEPEQLPDYDDEPSIWGCVL